jgi:hypothetical protein
MTLNKIDKIKELQKFENKLVCLTLFNGADQICAIRGVLYEDLPFWGVRLDGVCGDYAKVFFRPEDFIETIYYNDDIEQILVDISKEDK